MRHVRPTLQVLRQLPDDTFADQQQVAMLRSSQFDVLCLRDLVHPLLCDAADEFAGGGFPDTHREASKAAKTKVYEVRMRVGAAWRGAVVLDSEGDPWLVYVNKHDQFHHQAKVSLKSSNKVAYMPRVLDYKIRAREEARIEDLAWKVSVLVSLVETICSAMSSEQGKAEAQLTLPDPDMGKYGLGIQFEHEEPSHWSEAQNAAAMATLFLRVSPGGETDTLHRIVQVIVPYLQVQDPNVQVYFDRKGQLCIAAVLSQAKLIQLVASAGESRGELRPVRSLSPTHLHYVGDRFLNEAFIFGKEVRAVCGFWFVPTQNEGSETGLPICEACEKEKPVAVMVLNLIRASLA